MATTPKKDGKLARISNTPQKKTTPKKKAARKKVVAKKRVKAGRPRQETWTVDGERLTIGQIKADICEQIATTSKGLKRVCAKGTGYPNQSTILKWFAEDAEFHGNYTRAKEAQAEVLVDEIMEIADDSAHDMITDSDGTKRLDSEHVQRAKLRIDTRKWTAGKLKPKKYGDKMDLNVTTKEVEMSDEEMAQWAKDFAGK